MSDKWLKSIKINVCKLEVIDQPSASKLREEYDVIWKKLRFDLESYIERFADVISKSKWSSWVIKVSEGWIMEKSWDGPFFRKDWAKDWKLEISSRYVFKVSISSFNSFSCFCFVYLSCRIFSITYLVSACVISDFLPLCHYSILIFMFLTFSRM